MSLFPNPLLWSSPAAPPSLDGVWSVAEDEVLLKAAASNGTVASCDSSGARRSLGKALANQYQKARGLAPELFPKSEEFIQRAVGFVERLGVLQDPAASDPALVVRRRLIAGGFGVKEGLKDLASLDEEASQSDVVDPSRQVIFTVTNGYDGEEDSPPASIVSDGVKASEYSSLVRGVVSSRNPPWHIDLTTPATREIQECRSHYWEHIDGGTLGRFLVYCRHAEDIDAILTKPTGQGGGDSAQVAASLPTLLLASQDEMTEHISALDRWSRTVMENVRSTVESQKREELARLEEKYERLLETSLDRVRAVERAARERAESFFRGNEEDADRRFKELEGFQRRMEELRDARRVRWVEACFGKKKDESLLRLISCGVSLGSSAFVDACSRRLAEGLKDPSVVDRVLSTRDAMGCSMVLRAIPAIVSLSPLESLLVLSEGLTKRALADKGAPSGVRGLKEEVEKEIKVRREAEQQKLLSWPIPQLERALLSARSASATPIGRFKLSLLQTALDIKGVNGDDPKGRNGGNSSKPKLILSSSLAPFGSIGEDELTAEVSVQDRFLLVGSSAVLRSTAWKRQYFEASVLRAPTAPDLGPCVALGVYLSGDGEGISHYEAISRDMSILAPGSSVTQKSPMHEGIFVQDSGHVVYGDHMAYGDFSFGVGDTVSVLVDPQIRLVSFYKNGLPLVMGKGAEVVDSLSEARLSIPGPGDPVCVAVGLGLVKEVEWRRLVDEDVDLLEGYSPFQLMPGCVLFTPGEAPKCKVRFRFQPRFMYQLKQGEDEGEEGM